MFRKLFITLIAPLFVAATFFTVGCDTTTDDDDDGCESYVTEYTCENGACTCDDGGASCTDPDDTTADDADNCENLCEVCDD
jgi:hypothetical protein